MKIGYKVVKAGGLNGSYYQPKSAVLNIDDKASVFYHINKKVYPNEDCGPLCVFTDRETAEDFVYSSVLPILHVYPCIYKPSPLKRVWYSPEIEGVRYITELNELPKYTALASWVKLIEWEVYDIIKREERNESKKQY